MKKSRKGTGGPVVARTTVGGGGKRIERGSETGEGTRFASRGPDSGSSRGRGAERDGADSRAGDQAMERPAGTVVIDGSYGEGGGQIIRTALSLSAITGTPLEIMNIRARRTKPGLQPQHLTAVRAAAATCDAALVGDDVGSTALVFEPRRPCGEPGSDYVFDIGTAGASTLVAQTVLLPLWLGGRGAAVEVIGGTHVPHSPPAEYLQRVYLAALRRAGLESACEVAAAGFFPRGGGKLRLQMGGQGTLYPVDFTHRGKLRGITAFITTAQLPTHVAERGLLEVEKLLRAIGRRVEVDVRELPSNGPGAAVGLVVECESGLAGFGSVGERGKPMEKVAAEACAPFISWWKSEAGCDEHLADQLALPMAFAAGESRWSTPVVTEHLRTVLWVIRQFLPVTAELEERADGWGMVTMSGAAGR